MTMFKHAVGTELEMSDGPFGQVFRGKAYCPDGIVRRVHLGTPDTFFSCLAKVKAFGKWVSGFTFMMEPHSESSEKVVMFEPLSRSKNCGVFTKWTGVKPLKLYAKWFGGSSYALPGFDDIEKFDSVVDAMETFRSRLNDPYYPCIDTDNACMFLYYATSKHTIGDDPSMVLRFGPRGGVRVEMGFVETNARRLAKALPYVFDALCAADLSQLKLMSMLTLGELCRKYGKALDLRTEFVVTNEGKLI